jgi:hypothetical protein
MRAAAQSAICKRTSHSGSNTTARPAACAAGLSDHAVTETRHLASGVYFARLETAAGDGESR